MNREPTPRIELSAGRGYFRWVCDVCGEEQGKDGMLSRIWIGVNESIEICRSCLEAGPEGAIERAAKNAEYHQGYADALRNEYPDFLRGVREWATGKDYDAVRDAFEKELSETIFPDEEAPAEEPQEKQASNLSMLCDKIQPAVFDDPGLLAALIEQLQQWQKEPPEFPF